MTNYTDVASIRDETFVTKLLSSANEPVEYEGNSFQIIISMGGGNFHF